MLAFCLLLGHFNLFIFAALNVFVEIEKIECNIRSAENKLTLVI